MRSRLPLILLWLLFAVWLLGSVAFVVDSAQRGIVPIDFLAYQHAAEAISKNQSPYATAGESREIFRSFHRLESELQAAQALGEGRDVLREFATRPQQPGPYVYPPTLALLINSAILITAAATFHASGNTEVAEIGEAYQLLTPLLGAGIGTFGFSVRKKPRRPPQGRKNGR